VNVSLVLMSTSGGSEFVLICYRWIDVSRFFIFDHDRIMWVTWLNGLREICQT
jgi:hypothetical protein